MEAFYNSFDQLYSDEFSRISYEEYAQFIQSDYLQSGACPFTPAVSTARFIPADPSLRQGTYFHAHASGSGVNIPVPLHPDLVRPLSRRSSCSALTDARAILGHQPILLPIRLPDGARDTIRGLSGVGDAYWGQSATRSSESVSHRQERSRGTRQGKIGRRSEFTNLLRHVDLRPPQSQIFSTDRPPR